MKRTKNSTEKERGSSKNAIKKEEEEFRFGFGLTECCEIYIKCI